ncbi:stomatin-like protein 1 [Aplysia californica]|uniref:Stomatin-like protein 1 n=1 Tax=Aplysia californica TaxID=6500 RepID=A0ABM1W2G3_APLCA|nr:stomatin-like protein 1 [Aplysia californica]
MASSVKYSRLPMGDGEDSLTFDYSSAFSFEEKGESSWKYRSAFTYDNNRDKSQDPSNGTLEPSSADTFIRFMVTFGFYVVYLLTFPLMVWFSFKKIPTNQRLVVFRLGRLHKSKGPGLVFVFPILDRYHKVDVFLKAFSVPPKQVITEDGGIIEVGAEIHFQVMDAEKSVTNVQNLDRSTRILVQTSLCNILVQKSLSEIEAERRSIADVLMVNSNKVCVNWGVEISRVELSQIKVLSEPQAKKKPTLMMPPGMPGLFGGTAGGATPSSSPMPAALAQFASALLSSNPGSQQAQAVAQAMQAFTGPGLTPVDISGQQQQLQTSTATTAATAPGDPRSVLGVSGTSVEASMASSPVTLHTPLSHVQPAPGTSSGGQVAPDAPYSGHLVLDMPAVNALTPAEILASIQSALCPTLVQRIKATFQFEITGEGGGTYFLDLKNGDGFIGLGLDPSGDPAATLTLTFADLQAMLAGRLQPFQAYMSGRLRVSGDVSAALKLDELGKRMRSQSGVVNIL